MKKGDVLKFLREEIELRTKRSSLLKGEDLERNILELEAYKEARSIIWTCSKEKAAILLMDKIENLRVELDSTLDPKKGIKSVIFKNVYLKLKGR